MKTFCLLFLLAFLIMLLDPGVFEIPVMLLFGWPAATIRLAKAMQPGLSSLIWFSIGLVFLLAGSHIFLRWLLWCRTVEPPISSEAGHVTPWGPPERLQGERHARSDAPCLAGIEWRWKWTLCGFGIVFCTLAAIASLILTTHQVFWLSRSGDRLRTDLRSWIFTMHAARELQVEAEEVEWETDQTQAMFWRGDSRNDRRTYEAVQPVWIEKEAGTLQAIILIPRRPLHRASARISIIQPGGQMTTRRLSELPAVLASFGLSDAMGQPQRMSKNRAK